MAKSGNELVKVTSDELGQLLTFDEAVKFLTDKGYGVETVDEYLSDGFEEVDKKDLVNRTFLIVMAKMSLSQEYMDDNGDPLPFAVIKVITQDGKRFRFTDGSTGIAQQIKKLETDRPGGAVGAIIPGGLTVSEYKYIDEKGKPTPAKTYYFATA